MTILDNVWNACGRSTSHASSRADGGPVVTSELIDLHRRLAHEMRNAAIRAALVRLARRLRRFLWRSEKVSGSVEDGSTLP